jgi:hypothetical protein
VDEVIGSKSEPLALTATLTRRAGLHPPSPEQASFLSSTETASWEERKEGGDGTARFAFPMYLERWGEELPRTQWCPMQGKETELRKAAKQFLP